MGYLNRGQLLMILIQINYYFIYLCERAKQHAIPYSFYESYCKTLCKKLDKAKFVYLKSKFKLIARTYVRLGSCHIVFLENQKRNRTIYQ